MKIYIFSSVNWDSFWQQPQEVAIALASQVDVIFVNPVAVRNKDFFHLNKLNNNRRHSHIKIIDSLTKVESFGLRYLIKQERWFSSVVDRMKEDDIAIFYNPIGQTASYLKAKRRKVKIAFMFVDEYSILSANKLRKIVVNFFTRQMIKMSSKVFCTGRLLHEKAKKMNPKSIYLPNGVNYSELKNDLSKPRNKHKLPIIGYVGALAPWTKIEEFVEIAKEFNKEAEVQVIGTGERFQELAEAKKDLRLDNLVLYGPKSHKEVINIMKYYDICLCPFKPSALTDTVSPVKVFEYWAAKKCVIATKTYELSQYKKELIFYRNSHELITNIKELLKNPNKISSYGEAGFRKMLENHDWSRSLKDKLLKEIKEI